MIVGDEWRLGGNDAEAGIGAHRAPYEEGGRGAGAGISTRLPKVPGTATPSIFLVLGNGRL
jgi:hypothetical protein